MINRKSYNQDGTKGKWEKLTVGSMRKKKGRFLLPIALN
jgi:hypothetical protein